MSPIILLALSVPLLFAYSVIGHVLHRIFADEEHSLFRFSDENTLAAILWPVTLVYVVVMTFFAVVCVVLPSKLLGLLDTRRRPPPPTPTLELPAERHLEDAPRHDPRLRRP